MGLTARRGLQVTRKDKDMMADTGGATKRQMVKPKDKPPRHDLKKIRTEKNMTSEERDDLSLRTAASEELPDMGIETEFPAKETLDRGIDKVVEGLQFLIENKEFIVSNWEDDKFSIDEIYEFIEKALIPYTSEIVDRIDISEDEEK